MLNSLSSVNLLPIICIPIGRPTLSRPTGIESAGRPSMLIGTVQTSPAYISTGLAVFSPSLNAVFGTVGVISASNSAKEFLNSAEILCCKSLARL